MGTRTSSPRLGKSGRWSRSVPNPGCSHEATPYSVASIQQGLSLGAQSSQGLSMPPLGGPWCRSESVGTPRNQVGR